MILNGKCKEDFLEWRGHDEIFVKMAPPVYKHALIIEFFDSVGIHIYLSTGSYVSIPNFRYTIITQEYTCEGFKENTRKEAAEQAIIKANNIYNGE